MSMLSAQWHTIHIGARWWQGYSICPLSYYSTIFGILYFCQDSSYQQYPRASVIKI